MFLSVADFIWYPLVTIIVLTLIFPSCVICSLNVPEHYILVSQNEDVFENIWVNRCFWDIYKYKTNIFDPHYTSSQLFSQSLAFIYKNDNRLTCCVRRVNSCSALFLMSPWASRLHTKFTSICSTSMSMCFSFRSRILLYAIITWERSRKILGKPYNHWYMQDVTNSQIKDCCLYYS